MKEFDLGPVSAYALAVEQGFSGTLDEWLASLSARIGENGHWWIGDKDTGVLADPAALQALTEQAETAQAAAAGSASAAASSATTAGNAASAAQQSAANAVDCETAAKTAKAGAETAASAAKTSAESSARSAAQADAAAARVNEALSGADFALFEISADGDLYMTRAESKGEIDFALDADGNLQAIYG